MYCIPNSRSVQFNGLFTLLALTAFSLNIAISTPAQAQPKQTATQLNKAVGLWKSHTGDKVRIYKCGSQLCGKLITIRSRLKRDQNNPNPKLRKRALKGLTIMRSRKRMNPKKWVGTVYNINDGKTYNGSLQLKGSNTAQLTGCSSIGLCQSATWKKISKTRVTALKNKK